RKLKIGANDYQSGYISLIIDNLKTVASPFVGKLETLFVNLSPREIEICKMLKDGMTSKEIGEMLGTSAGTVFNQRKTIRKKLNIANDNINLVTFLKSI
ncbi:MAG TPA: LuxR family transcriptional regulator, partial [candidate division Zixibacteria bacterium]|nr:LuxR family transcriptional regulator [candidate division Zixibacteria bacterium]